MSVIDEIAAERRRQIEQEGWTPEHDDCGQLAMAAGWYALNAKAHHWSDVLGVADPDCVAYRLFAEEDGFYRWPWSRQWWKPKNPRRDLIRAAALIVAEIERLDRAETPDA